MPDPFGWGGLYLVPAIDKPAAPPLRELQRIADEAEAERFRLETERDLKGEDE